MPETYNAFAKRSSSLSHHANFGAVVYRGKSFTRDEALIHCSVNHESTIMTTTATKASKENNKCKRNKTKLTNCLQPEVCVPHLLSTPLSSL